ncbi:MAG: F0F1 ATP synthase subunit delta [Candidatus Paceibacterota bacterium]
MNKNSSKKIGILLAKKISHAKTKEEAGEIIKAFAKVIVSKRLASKSPAILRSFKKEWNTEKGIVDVIIKALSIHDAPKIENVFGKKAEVTFIEDKTLLGGSEIKINDLVIDTTIKSKLQKMRSKLVN